jgi:hypothetical protein
MKYYLHISMLLLGIMLFGSVSAQDLFDVFGKDTVKTKNYTYATFKTTRVIFGQSVENSAKGTMLFLFSHHFGPLNSGTYNFFGLDQTANVRLGLEYGISNRLAIGIARSNYEKTIDGFLKFKLLRQSKGYKSMPLSVSLFASTDLISQKWQDPTRRNFFWSRMSFVYQALIASKVNNNISLQLTPTLIHKNLVPTPSDKNDTYALGFGGRCKLSERVSLNAEYFYVMNRLAGTIYTNSLSVGVDIETGGHVFQLHFTNSQPMFERGFITETASRWDKGGIYFGFNITRAFTIVKHKNSQNR